MAIPTRLDEIIGWIKKNGNTSVKDGMSRFGIPSDKAFGIAVGDLRKYAKELGKDHALAQELWQAEWYEARLLACFVDIPDEVTPRQMDDWCRDFDSWAICDTACFHLFDRTPHAWKKIQLWAKRKPEFEKRGAFALLACVALHDREAEDELFADSLSWIETASTDERNFVKKGVSWALRAIGNRNPDMHSIATALAEKLSQSKDSTQRWIGKDALKDLASPASQRRMNRSNRKSQ